MSVRVLYAGLCTTVQDSGRRGWQRAGVSVAGAADADAFALGNLLLGNAADAASLETTLNGPTLLLETDCAVALTGAAFAPTVNGVPVPMYRALALRAGDELALGGASRGCRGYIAFAGGLDVPRVMGSRSTDLKAGIGGLAGRRLRAGDLLLLARPVARLSGMCARTLPPPDFPQPCVLRVVAGPQRERFTDEGFRAFTSSEYVVSPNSDRMGVRLEGAPVARADASELLSEGVCAGAVQIPSGGAPIVMLCDCQPTGGYPRVAHVLTVDLPRAAQLRPGDRVRFAPASLEQAQRLIRERAAALDALARGLAALPDTARGFRVTVRGRTFEVTVAETTPRG